MSIRIATNEEDGLSTIWDSVLEENGWIIVEQSDHRWALYENSEHYILNPNDAPYNIYENHELGDAIKQGQKWT